MEKNEILMIYGKNYKEMTKEILTSAKLAEQIGDKKKKIGLKPNLVVAKTPDSADKVLAISHCNCPARAQVLKEAFEERMKLAKIIVLDTAGVSSMYANDGGVIVAV